MSSLTHLPFCRLTFIWISGIIGAIYYPINRSVTLLLILTFSLLYLSIFTLFKLKLRQTALPWLNLIGLLLIFLASYGNVLLHTAQKKQGDLSKWFLTNQPLRGYKVRIEKVYNTSHDSFACKAFVTQVRSNSGWHNSTGCIQLYFSKKSDYKPEKFHILLIRGSPVQTLSQRQPAGSFISSKNHPTLYRHLLKQQNRDFMLLIPPKTRSRKPWPVMIHQWCNQMLQKQVKEEQAIMLINALLFGEKDQFNPALHKAYADTGTIHVLAVSGLHVGMLYMLIGSIFRFIFTNIGSYLLSDIFTLIVLWLYAWLCHFKPPILRATIMITIARLGFLMRRETNSYNGLCISAFALLLWNPFFLLNWGFQLSYMATLGILYLQPYIHNVITVKNYWLQKIWNSTSLSIAAQISTLPLILHYFKQFPLYFIIANWIVVPAIFAILILSLALVTGSYLPVINTLLGFVLTKLINATNLFVCWVAQWPISTLHNCSINSHSACLLYVTLISICLFFKYKNLIYAILIGLCITFYTVNQIQYFIAEQNKYKLICFNNDALSFALKDSTKGISCYNLQPSSKVPYLQFYASGIIASWHGKTIFAIKTIPVDWYFWNRPKLNIDYLLITQTLLDEKATFIKVFNIKTLIVYSNKPNPLYYDLKSKMQKLGTILIWLKPDTQKIITWSKNKNN